jgi:CRP-like cAMP-binding protein
MSPAIALLVRVLSRRDTVAPEEIAVLESLPQRPETFARGVEFIAEGSRPGWSCLLEEGLAARAVSRANGSRQLTALHIPGDFVDLHGLLLKPMDHGVLAMSACKVVFFRHSDLRRITESAPHLTRLLWLSTTVDAAIQRRMTALIGRHTPLERLGHLLCEMYSRMEAVGLAADGRFRFPITQAELADLLGLSVVHTNRTVQDLRATGMVSWAQNVVSIEAFGALARTVGFDPAYLNLSPEPR